MFKNNIHSFKKNKILSIRNQATLKITQLIFKKKLDIYLKRLKLYIEKNQGFA